MPITFKKWITRADLRACPEWRYVFGDNVQRAGRGGQAKEMRGEPNAIGVATKWAPHMRHDAFFTDIKECKDIILTDLAKVEDALKEGRVVVWPWDGIGSGRAHLDAMAPRLFFMMKRRLEEMQSAYRAR
jgi:hypothetical protein